MVRGAAPLFVIVNEPFPGCGGVGGTGGVAVASPGVAAFAVRASGLGVSNIRPIGMGFTVTESGAEVHPVSRFVTTTEKGVAIGAVAPPAHVCVLN
jgi:hypothetical protein